MAISINLGMRTIFQSAYTIKPNISEYIDALDPRDLSLLAMLGWGTEAGTLRSGADNLSFPATQTVHTWQGDSLIPAKGTLGAAYTSGGGTLTLTTGEGDYIRVGDQIVVNGVHYIVTAQTTSTVDVTVLAGSTDANHDSGDVWINMGSMVLDGETFQTDYQSTDLTTDFNHTQIFRNAVSVSGTSLATEKFGIDDEFARELGKKFEEMVIQLEKAAIYGKRTATHPTANATRALVRRMGGLAHFIRDDAAANVVDAEGAMLTEQMLVNLLEDIWSDGGNPTMIMVGSRQKRMLDSFIVPYVRTDINNDRAGIQVGTYVSDYGSLEIVLSRHLLPTDLVVLSPQYIAMGPLKGNGEDRSFHLIPEPVKGDSVEATILGEYTMEVRNAKTAHGWIKNLGTSLS